MNFTSVAIGLVISSLAFAKPVNRTQVGELYNNADGSPLISLIGSAKKSIGIEIYTMTAPELRVALRAALAKKRPPRIDIVKEAKPVSEVCNLFDSTPPQINSITQVQAQAETADCMDQRKLVTEIKSAGGTFVPFNHAAFCSSGPNTCLEHGKLLLIDRGEPDAVALLSSGNFDASNLCTPKSTADRCNRDFSFVTNNPNQLSLLKTVFESDLKGKQYDLKSPTERQADLTISPYSFEPLKQFINSATYSISIQNQYLKEPLLNQLLIDRARAGIKIQIEVASLCAFSRPSTQEAVKERANYGAFSVPNISLRFFTDSQKINEHPGYLHAKAIVVDGARAWMGSVNGSDEALNRNREFGVFFSDLPNVQKLEKLMSSDFSDPSSESLEQSLSCLKDLKPN